MKSISQTFTNDEFTKLKEKKGDKSWRKFILDLANIKEDSNGGN